MRETERTSKLKLKLNGFFHKNHGSPMMSGLPDLEGTIAGRSIVIEVKVGSVKKDHLVLNYKLTDKQKFYLTKYKANGAIALLAIYITEAKDFFFLDFEDLGVEFSSKSLQLSHSLYKSLLFKKKEI